MPWRVTVRSGPEVERLAADSLDGALSLAEQRARELAATTRRAPVETRMRTFDAVQQVAHRVEIAGPGRLLARIRAGLAVRGDGSVEAFTGRASRSLVQPERGEDPYRALRRTVGA